MRSAIPGALVAIFAMGVVASIAPARAPAGELPLTREAVIHGPANEVWRLITTKRGMESWLVPHDDVDLRVGGLVRTNHDPAGTIGDAKTVTNRILALKPGRMFSLQVAEAPRDFPFADPVQGTWYEIYVDPLPHGQTRVRCVGHGFSSDPVGFTARAFVDRGSLWAFQQLEKVFEDRRGKPGTK